MIQMKFLLCIIIYCHLQIIAHNWYINKEFLDSNLNWFGKTAVFCNIATIEWHVIMYSSCPASEGRTKKDPRKKFEILIRQINGISYTNIF